MNNIFHRYTKDPISGIFMPPSLNTESGSTEFEYCSTECCGTCRFFKEVDTEHSWCTKNPPQSLLIPIHFLFFFTRYVVKCEYPTVSRDLVCCGQYKKRSNLIGWSAHEQLGISIINPRGITKMGIDIVSEDPPLTEEEQEEQRIINKGW